MKCPRSTLVDRGLSELSVAVGISLVRSFIRYSSSLFHCSFYFHPNLTE